MIKSAILVLEDGTQFHGRAIGAEGVAVGEVVFNTSMTGYQEILTDPSYSRQIVTLTYPHIGNVGINAADEESPAIQAQGLIIRDLPLITSNYRSEDNLSNYLKRHDIVAIADIDTRKLTRLLREKGAQNGCIIAGDEVNAQIALEKAKAFPGLKGMDLAQEVTTTQSYQWLQGSWTLADGLPKARKEQELPYHIVAYDFGVKRNILRMLVDRGCRVTVVPAKTSADEVLKMAPDGIFLSNGPGDPEPCDYAIEAIKTFLNTEIPVFGICLGHQLLALASGAKTVKMKFGHHGGNHPVKDLDRNVVMITAQNHGFAVDENSLPANLRVTHKSLFDGTLQGIHRTDKPAFSFQGHPEASPGPHEAASLFDHFIELIELYRQQNTQNTK
ncbi:glutamine-hydrolyzing carbamoyl-phosphate synthase small subunit [Xenorhabdus budapestensis]|uniref:Carbamoyl phosphate synthase small chain n=1 Tax=Xenorhabdus budapestensis TaxID=290110 RepID=A0A2D0J1V7_XENBU|nr:glutamine-hydrolyzing carbamoyl-phosphate synthase small subunit [Xenorhabdus budapestensis]PHM28269.1 carbamoyl phosphate synthetase small subunit, glutamine amidotransferase [Xenorhabdus budapestensis]QTL40437.1 glutamine-hydrolyzing carbamoyl-phosphate synthase small subunit [Xenorhabdus budapestensis]